MSGRALCWQCNKPAKLQGLCLAHFDRMAQLTPNQSGADGRHCFTVARDGGEGSAHGFATALPSPESLPSDQKRPAPDPEQPSNPQEQPR